MTTSHTRLGPIPAGDPPALADDLAVASPKGGRRKTVGRRRHDSQAPQCRPRSGSPRTAARPATGGACGTSPLKGCLERENPAIRLVDASLGEQFLGNQALDEVDGATHDARFVYLLLRDGQDVDACLDRQP